MNQETNLFVYTIQINIADSTNQQKHTQKDKVLNAYLRVSNIFSNPKDNDELTQLNGIKERKGMELNRIAIN